MTASMWSERVMRGDTSSPTAHPSQGPAPGREHWVRTARPNPSPGRESWAPATTATQPHPRATARVPTPLHTSPALTKIRCSSSARRSLCKGGGRVDAGRGPLRSPWGGLTSIDFYPWVRARSRARRFCRFRRSFSFDVFFLFPAFGLSCF